MSEVARNFIAVCCNGSPEQRNYILRNLVQSSEPGADKLLDGLLKSGTVSQAEVEQAQADNEAVRALRKGGM